MCIVDRKKHKNLVKAFLFDLSFNVGSNTPWVICGWIFFIFLTYFFGYFGLFDQASSMKYFILYFLGPIWIALPFLKAVIVYFSRLSFSGDFFEISCFGFNYRKGKISNIIAIYRFVNWNGCYFIRYPGMIKIS